MTYSLLSKRTPLQELNIRICLSMDNFCTGKFLVLDSLHVLNQFRGLQVATRLLDGAGAVVVANQKTWSTRDQEAVS